MNSKLEKNVKLNNKFLCWQKSCFRSSLSKRTAERLRLSWWWIPLLARTWQVFVRNIILSASPEGSLQMQIPVAVVFYDTCSCFPGRRRQVSHRGLANQDGKLGMGGQVGLLSCQCCPSSTFAPPSSPFPPFTALPFVLPSVIFIAPSLSPSRCLSVGWGHCTPPLPHTGASASFCHRLSLQSLMLTDVLCELGQRASSFLYRCLVHAKEIGSNSTLRK